MLMMSLYLVLLFQVYKNWLIYDMHRLFILWRFNFGIKKTKCMMICKDYGCFTTTPQWYLKNKRIQNVDILGVTFNNNVKYNDYVITRIQKPKWSMFSISNIGMSYPGLNTKSKVHLYKTICLPTLLYGVDCLSVSVNNVVNIQKATSWNTFVVSAKDIIIVDMGISPASLIFPGFTNSSQSSYTGWFMLCKDNYIYPYMV